jgi:hypothetical protein
MRDANDREEQFRKRIQPNINTDTPTEEIQPSLSTISSASSLSFHTPAIDQSPNIAPIIDTKSSVVSSPLKTIEKMDTVETLDMISLKPKEKTQTIIRHTATEETTQADYRSGIKIVPSNVLKSTIQNYMIDHNPFDENQGTSNNI